MTSTNFLSKMQSTGTVIMNDNQNQSEFNKSQLVLKNGVFPPYGLALKQGGENYVLGLVENETTEHESAVNNEMRMTKDQLDYINLKDINNGIHPVLLEAYKQ